MCIGAGGPGCDGHHMALCNDEYKNCLGRCCVQNNRCYYVPTGACRAAPLKTKGAKYTGECASSP